ncbi:hypothetical protein Moror_11868 [Moniliophthora roreri MCA 2997]|uniref:Uncharacterized protein n=1 Tax=Moniliophthora roreri (strain MCA 2997) TaxID=1381753 RepID=V2WJZ0_MONRO|nr:hypothetical protein Moror_11868 [Moniliophthora roreri MCA 2997]
MFTLVLISFILSLGCRCIADQKPGQKLSLFVPPTGAVNVPVTCTWEGDVPPGTYEILLILETPPIPSPASKFSVTVNKDQTHGTFPFTAKRAGTYHLEVSFPQAHQTLRVGGPITITDTSSSALAATTNHPNPITTARTRTTTTTATTSTPINGGEPVQRPAPTQTPSNTPVALLHTTTEVIVSASLSQTVTQSTSITTIVTTTNGTVVTEKSTITTPITVTSTFPQTTTSVGVIATGNTTQSPPPSSNTEQQADTGSSKSRIIGAVLGTLLGVLIILALILLYRRYRRRRYNRAPSSIAFDRDKMVSGRRWWTPPPYTFARKSHTEVSYQPEPDVISLATSESVSQLWSESNVTEKRLPARPSTDVSEKVG